MSNQTVGTVRSDRSDDETESFGAADGREGMLLANPMVPATSGAGGSGMASESEMGFFSDNSTTVIAKSPGIQASGGNLRVRGTRSNNSQLAEEEQAVLDRVAGSDGRAEVDAKMELASKSDREAWTGDIEDATAEDVYEVYLSLRKKYFNSTVFYLDVADALDEYDRPDLALRVVSNLAELRGEDHRDLRILGHRLSQSGELDLAPKKLFQKKKLFLKMMMMKIKNYIVVLQMYCPKIWMILEICLIVPNLNKLDDMGLTRLIKDCCQKLMRL